MRFRPRRGHSNDETPNEPTPEASGDGLDGRESNEVADPESATAEDVSQGSVEPDVTAEHDDSQAEDPAHDPVEDTPTEDPEPEVAAEPEADPEPEPEPDADAEPEPEAAAEPEGEPEADPEPQPEPEADAEPEGEPEADPEPQPEPEADAEPEGEPEADREPQPEPEADAEPLAAPPPPVADDSASFSALDGFTDDSVPVGTEDAGGKPVLAMLLGLAVLLGVGYTAAYAVAGDNVPRGASVSGVKIGGHSKEQAERILERGLSERAAAPMKVMVGSDLQALDPQEAGLSVDYPASVAEVGGGRSWSPQRLWDYYTGGDDIPAVVEVDQAKLDDYVASLDEESGSEPVEGFVRFKDGKVKSRTGKPGISFDADQVGTALRDAYLNPAKIAEIAPGTTQPEIQPDAVQTALNDFANPAVSGPITLSFGKAKVTLQPEQFTQALSLEPKEGALVPVLDDKRLFAIVDESVSSVDAPVDATVRLVNGTPTVIPDKPGVSYDHQQLAATFLDTVANPDNRDLRVKATAARAKFTTKDAQALKIKERVSTFTTYYPYAEYRNINLGRAAQLINGTVLKPGETFSLNGTVGERTEANGFTKGFIISEGVFKEELGGGVSQMATTLFNAMFFAGLKDVEHKPHSFYIDRYPVGREATVVWGALDLRFQNDTPYGVLINVGVSPASPGGSGAVTVNMYSTKYWDITSSTSNRYNFTEPKTREMTGDDCVANSGYGGFDVDVTRYFRKPGQSALDHQEVFHTTYTPADTVICKAPEKPKN